jgi:hypothetical protein
MMRSKRLLLPKDNERRADLLSLNVYAVAPRYPGFGISMSDAAAAVTAMKRGRSTLRKVLGIRRKSSGRKRKR